MEPVHVCGCPELTALQQYLRNELAHEHTQGVDAHVGSCAACQKILSSLIDRQAPFATLDRLLKERARSLFVANHEAHRMAATRSVGNTPPAPAGRLPAGGTEKRPLNDFLPASIGGYRVLAELGRGAYGVVYHAHDGALDRPVAIKTPRGEVIAAVGGVESFLNEARTLASLDHPHIVRVHEARADGENSCYVVSQYIAGQSLADRLKKGRLDPVEAARMLAALADALQHAHERGIWHRDVKPANILLDTSGKPYLADFGLALKEDEIGRGPGLLGTPAYMSPEQARGEGHRVDGRTDIFSLGVVFYEALTGKRPFLAASSDELLKLIVGVDAPSARQKDRTISAELDRICAKALARRLSDRYRSASDMADDLNAWLRTEQAKPRLQAAPGQPVPARAAGPMARLARRRRPLVPGLMAAIVLLAFGLGAAVLPSTAPRTNVLRIGIKPWVGFSPLVVAAELGLCDGVDLTLTPVRNTTDVRQRIYAHELDAAPYLVDSHALARANRTPIKVILQLDVSLQADAIIAREGIRAFADLRGKRVAYIHHEAPHFLLLSLCEKHQVPPDQFQHETAETAREAVDLFLSGKVDAVVTYEPFLQLALSRPGASRLASAADDPGAIIDVLTVREELLQTDRPKVQALIAGWMKAVDLLERRDPAAVEIACRFLGKEGQPLRPEEYFEMALGMKYGTKEENLRFFRLDDRGSSEFRDRLDAAQRRWDRHHQIIRLTDPKDGDGSDVLLEMYAPR